ncbi:DUF3891 family protein [Niallia endozanthoxylica]|uniref:DUF3891 family protein n=1 Tax=Niallia endozanthoxylica TaxID=2036016 RepID=A0A5J5HW87_9BACI|nr:DUF3891 family protein [Niallia endozanthoxylica]KAA9026972.1 DUF3891 family protein [Niallia endozanthoxylica]
MIVREQEDTFILIEQDNHGLVSGEIMENWKKSLFHGEDFWQSVQYAIRYHDYGWKSFDKQPFWNDRGQAPYTFSNYPLSPKTVIYTFGINEVEKHDPYAALLCSKHYSRFLLPDSSQTAVAFIEQEKERQQRIIHRLGEVDKDLFSFHYGMLRFGDDISLYLCLNEPGVLKDKEHFFFQKGITLPKQPGQEESSIMTLQWRNRYTVSVNPFPFEGKISIQWKQKVLSKKDIVKNGLIKSYEKQLYEDVAVDIVPE